MYSIGQFSIICNLNKKTLRYYDEIDLFKPAQIDVMNQYRYYEKSQIPIIQEILRLKEIGIPLEQIKRIISEHNSVQMNEIYIQRLKEIDILVEQLKVQKDLIEAHLRNKTSMDEMTIAYTIYIGYFIEEGNVYYNQIRADYDNINTVISDFYSSANGLVLTSGHIFKRNLDENSDGFSEIFAYTSVGAQHQDIKVQTKTMCLKIICDGIKNREYAYKQLFDYASDNEYTIQDIYEKYQMTDGKMYMEIMASIL